jgi:hypothetical protein
VANNLIEYRLRIRNAANSADALEVTSVRGGTNPYIATGGEPKGDGASFNPNTGVVTSGAFTGRIIDPITSGTSRLFTSIMEDANGRQQLGQRRAFWEFRVDGGSWTVLYAGRLSRYALASDIEWEITVSDWMKAEHEVTVFGADPDEDIINGVDGFLDRWPKRGCLCGGPVMGGIFRGHDLGGWIMRVRAAPNPTNRYRLEPVQCYGPGSWSPGSDILASPGDGIPSIGAKINEIARTLPHGSHRFATIPFETVEDTQAPGCEFPGLVVLIDGVPWRPISPFTAGVRYKLSLIEYAWLDLIGGKPGEHGLFVYKDSQSALSDGSIVTVRVLTVLPTEACPIYYEGHYADLLALLWEEAGIPYDTAALETVRDTIGASLNTRLQITEPKQLGSFLEEAVYGPIGIAARQGTDGELEAFCTRIFPNSLPAVTIDEDDVVDGSTRAFDLDTGAAVAEFTLEHRRIQSYVSGLVVDGVVTQQHRFERANDDPGSIGTGKVSYDVPGQIDLAETQDFQLKDWVYGRAAEVFDRHGRGPIGLRTTLIRGGAGDSVKLGDEILVDLPQLPNANKRLADAAVSARAMQIVHLSQRPEGKDIECIDSGPNAAPYATVPTVSIAQSSDRPRNVAEVEITNAATLNADSAACRVQIAFDTGGGAPAAEDYSDVAYFPAGQIPTSAYRLPTVTADVTVYVRARAEKRGSRPSSWGAVDSVALDPLDPPTGVTGTPSGTDKSRADIVWTIGADSDDAFVEVWLSLASETFADAKLIETLPPGSDRYSIYYDFAAATAYTVYVRHRDIETNDLSAEAEDDFTTGSTTVTLSAPTNPYGFSAIRQAGGSPSRTFGATPGLIDGAHRYGIVVKATEIPGFVEVQEAVEDSVGAGTYGAYATKGTGIPSVAGDWTMYTSVAPSDGLRRKLKARHVRDGTTASAYTSEVLVTPGANSPISQFPLNNLLTTALVDSLGRPVDSSLRFRCRVSHGSTQTISDTTITALAFDTEAFDTGVLHDTVTNNSRVTIPTGGNTGGWLFQAQVRWIANATGERYIGIRKNGATVLAETFVPAGASDLVQNVVAIDNAPSVGDYYEVIVYQNSGANRTVQTGAGLTWFAAAHLF